MVKINKSTKSVAAKGKKNGTVVFSHCFFFSLPCLPVIIFAMPMTKHHLLAGVALPFSELPATDMWQNSTWRQPSPGVFKIDEFCMVWVASQRHVVFFFCNRIREKQFFTLPVVNDNEIVQSTSSGVEGKSGLIFLVRYIRSCWCRRVSQFLVTLDNG